MSAPQQASIGGGGAFYLPYPVLALASDGGNSFLTAGGGGSGCTKEVPNVVQAHKYDEETGKLNTFASLNTAKAVVVHLAYSSATNLWLASIGKGCKILQLDEGENTLTELCTWDTEEDGKAPEQNFAKYSPDATLIVTGGTDGIVQVWKVKEPDSAPVLFQKCGEKKKEIEDAEFSSNNNLLASCDKTGDVTVWKIDEDQVKNVHMLSYTSNKASGKGKLFVKRVAFLVKSSGEAALIMSASGGRGPGLVGIFEMDGTKLREVMIDSTAPLKSLALDAFCGRLVIGTMSGGKAVFSLPTLSLVKKTKPIHSLPSQAVAAIGQNSVVSVSGDRSIHFMNCNATGPSKFVIIAYLLVVVITVFIVFFLLQQGGLEWLADAPGGTLKEDAALDAARKVADSVSRDLDGEL